MQVFDLKETQLWAIWKYQSGNGEKLLGGPIDKITAQGKISTHNYGSHDYFTPVIILPELGARALLKKSEQLHDHFSATIAKQVKEYTDAYAQLLADNHIT